MLTLPAPFDAHVHFRQGDLLSVVKHHDRVFEYALVMPNVEPAIVTADQAVAYEDSILHRCTRLKPLMTLKLTPEMTPNVLQEAAKKVVACKLYPDGMTNNSHGGFTRFHLENRTKYLYPLLDEMQRLRLVLCIHGELPPYPNEEDYCLDRENGFLYVLRDICKFFPRLKIVLEHITTKDAVDFVKMFDNLAATVTYHHLLLTLNDVIGVKIRPHNYCLPTAKRPADKKALQRIVIEGHDRIFFGSDSAPHVKDRKECAEGCAGCYTAPLLLEGLAEVFDSMNALGALKHFVSDAGRAWYNLPAPAYEVNLERKEWIVPDEVDGCVPFKAGHTMKWSIAEKN